MRMPTVHAHEIPSVGRAFIQPTDLLIEADA